MPRRLNLGPNDLFVRAEDVFDLDAIANLGPDAFRTVLSSGAPPLGQRIARHQPHPVELSLWDHLEGVEFVVDRPSLDADWG